MDSRLEEEIRREAFDHAEKMAEQMLQPGEMPDTPLYKQVFEEEHQKFLREYGLDK